MTFQPTLVPPTAPAAPGTAGWPVFPAPFPVFPAPGAAPVAETPAAMAQPALDGLGGYGENAVLDLGALRRDPSYQRDLDERHVAKLAAAWDPAQVGRLIVNQRTDGDYYIIDGQHRAAAAERRALTRMPAVLFRYLTVEEEAAMHLRLNKDRKPPSRFDLHKSGYAAGDPEPRAVQRLLAEFRCELVPYRPRNCWDGGTDGWARISAVGEVYAVYKTRRDGPAILRETVRLITTVWRGEAHAFDQDVLQGLAAFIHRAQKDPAYNEKRLVAVLRERTPGMLQRQARDDADAGRTTTAKRLPYTLWRLYNHGLRGKRLAPFPSAGDPAVEAETPEPGAN